MKPLSTNLFKLFVWILGIFVLAKAFWVTIGLLWLPCFGVDEATGTAPKPLYYRPKFSSSLLPPPPPPKKPTATKSPKPTGSIGDIKLYGIYATDEVAVVALEYKGKKEVLRTGESIGGFTLVGAKSDRAFFEKGGKRYEVVLDRGKKGDFVRALQPIAEESVEQAFKIKPSGKIIDTGDAKIIDRSLVEYYRKNFKEIQKNIGIIGVKKGDGFEGFKVVYIKPKSHFSQLGLQKGDVIKSVNGIVLDSLQAAMDIYKQADNMEAMTMVIERNNQEVEFEYEIN